MGNLNNVCHRLLSNNNAVLVESGPLGQCPKLPARQSTQSGSWSLEAAWVSPATRELDTSSAYCSLRHHSSFCDLMYTVLSHHRRLISLRLSYPVSVTLNIPQPPLPATPSPVWQARIHFFVHFCLIPSTLFLLIFGKCIFFSQCDTKSISVCYLTASFDKL